MTDGNILGIIWWDADDGRHYRCRGFGIKYRYFYDRWIKTTSYRCTSEDWPWDFFVFDDPNDHERLIQEFPGDVSEDKE